MFMSVLASPLRISALFVVVFLHLPLLVQKTFVASAEESAKYVGADVCQGCHQDSYDTFLKSRHAATLKSKKVATQGCEGCHGPGAEHVNSGGDPSLIERYAGVRAEVILERCQRCHEHDIGRPHTTAGLSCLTCHSAHHPRQQKTLLVKAPLELCRGCHSDRITARPHN